MILTRFIVAKDLEKHNKAVFLLCASSNSFDPLIPANWYQLPKEIMLATKVNCSSVILSS